MLTENTRNRLTDRIRAFCDRLTIAEYYPLCTGTDIDGYLIAEIIDIFDTQMADASTEDIDRFISGTDADIWVFIQDMIMFF